MLLEFFLLVILPLVLNHPLIRSSCIVSPSIIALFLTYQVGQCEPCDVQQGKLQGPLCLGWGIFPM